VFEKFKNGQKKCPILENPKTFGKQEFPKMGFRPECSCFQKIEKNIVIINFFYFLRKGFRNFFSSLYMTSSNVQNCSTKFLCEKCNYSTSRKSQYERHLLTPKHKKASDCYVLASEKVPKTFKCNCGKEYKHDSSYYKHKKICKQIEPIVDTEQSNNVILELLKQNQEFKELIIEQNKQIVELASKVGANTINNTTNNTTNNFNLQFFLNEQCKDALNIMDFINQLQLNTNDLDMVGRVGYSEGISKLFIRGLKELDVFKRPVHCSDLKREVVYVKDKDAWEKDNEEKKKMKTAIKYIAAKNFKQINEWREKNPESNDYDSQRHMDYHQIIIHSMGGSTKEEDEKHYNKIIKNVAKEVIIDKTDPVNIKI
jgi:hypothetical protein